MKTKALLVTALVCIGVLALLAGCGGEEKNPKVEFEMANGDTFILELYPEYAPDTVKNFVKLVEEGFYDGLTFHRVAPGFMAQGGGYGADDYLFSEGNKKPADSIKGEFAANGFRQNTLKHTRGVISMARTNEPNSASSEFFIMFDSSPGLDGDYAAFGKVIEGMETIDKFLEVERYAGFAADRGNATIPVTPIVIKKASKVK